VKRILALGCVLLTGCTYGPVRERASVWVTEPRFNTRTFAVALDWKRYRDPTGLSRLPDGGAPASLREEARFFVCDLDSRSVRLLAAFPKTKEMESGFQGWIEGWDGDAVYVTLTGRRTSWRQGAVGPLNRERYRLGLDGSRTRVESVPTTVHRGPMTGTSLPGETTFLRVGTYRNTITVRLTERGPFVPIFEVNPDGTITPIGRM
jgi:hypothetical protein